MDLSGTEDFVKFVNGIRGKYWSAEEYTAFFALCNRIVTEFPNDPLAAEILANEIYGYILRKDIPPANAKLETLWTKYRSAEGFVTNANRIRGAYWGAGEYAAFFSLCDRIISEFPDHALAAEILANAAYGYILRHDMAAAEDKTDELFTKYSQSADSFVEGMNRIISAYNRLNDSGKVIELGNRVLKIYPDHERSLPIYTGLIQAYLDLNALEQADAAINTILEKYPEHPEIAKMINGAADSYRKAKHYSRSIELYQTALNKAGDTKAEQLCAHTGIAMNSVWLNDNAKVSASLDTICANFSNDKKLPYAVFVIGEEYFKKGFPNGYRTPSDSGREELQKCLAVWSRIISDAPDDIHLAYSYYYSAIAYRYLNDYQKSTAYFEKITADWPDYEYAWNAQYLIGENLEKQKSAGLLTSEQADPLIRQAYQEMIEQYPDSSLADNAQRRLEALSQ